jgi:hypothetical protein
MRYGWYSLPKQHTIKQLDQKLGNKQNVIASEYQPLQSWWGMFPPPKLVSSTPNTAMLDTLLKYYESDMNKANLRNMKSWSFMTVLRHPVKRLISHFHYEGLDKFYSSYEEWAIKAPFHTQNFYVRMLAGIYPEGMDKVRSHPWAVSLLQ